MARFLKNALFETFVDGGLSFADEILGAGLAGLDIGDAIAGIIILLKERKQSGWFVGLLAGFEAFNFGLGFIPPIEYFFNIFPFMATINIFLAKYGAVKKEVKRIEEEERVAKEEHVLIGDVTGEMKKIKELVKQDNPVAALDIALKEDKEISKKLKEHVDKISAQVRELIQQIIEQDPESDESTIRILQEGLNTAEALLKESSEAEAEGKFDKAAESAKKARESLNTAIEEFNAAYSGGKQ